MLSRLKEFAMGAGKRLAGRTDLLEAVCASAALIAAADGNIGDDEVASALDVIRNNKILSGAFDPRTVEATMDTMLGRAKGGYSGRAGLWGEINDVAKKSVEDRETVFLIAMDVATADGNIDPKEQLIIDKLVTTLGIDTKKFV